MAFTTLHVTHDQAEALVTSDRIVVMRAGQLEQEGTSQDVYRRPVTAFGVVEREGGLRLRRRPGPTTRRGRRSRCPSRPHAIRLTPASDPPGSAAGAPGNRLGGTIIAACFGHAIGYQVAGAGTAAALRATADAGRSLSGGSRSSSSSPPLAALPPAGQMH